MERADFDAQIWGLRLCMLRFAASILRTPQDIEDAVSSAVVLAYQSVGSLRKEESLKPWLLTITARCCYAQLKKGRRETPVEDIAPLCPPVELPDWEGTLLEALRALPADYAQTLALYYCEGLRTEEIARVLAISRSGVSMRLKRGRGMLKAWLEHGQGGNGT